MIEPIGSDQDSDNISDEEEGVLDLNLKDFDEEKELDELYEQESSDEDITTAWGDDKKAYYDTNYAGGEVIDDVSDAEEAALEEEREALAIQKQMIATLSEDDFDLNRFQLPAGDMQKPKEEIQSVPQDISKLSREEKLKILLRESPELFELLEDFRRNMCEMKDRTYPLVVRSREGEFPNKMGVEYLETKLKLQFNYCINILFYLVLRSQQYEHLKHHPVIAHLVKLRALVGKLKQLDDNMAVEVNQLLNTETEDVALIGTSRTEMKQRKKQTRQRGKKRKAEVAEEEMETWEATQEEQVDDDPLGYYERVKREKADRKMAKADKLQPHFEQISQEEEHAPGDKRAISYQIAKNKGLLPHRKKEQRNPRVKHRRKYRSALIKRKSQIRPVVDPVEHYGGELSGIRSHLTKSVKIH
ncbi:something about silencing protein 10-like [Corticium candelabrum]|uniref:something about silencing protein 10-like n=1 Tax=Corticium candelabrum TaxID=121492 RepID=UPI002E259354|nr:something about silencing protein 10-like [Corticium candelabrum]